jgi:hypothetical protein
VYVVGKNETKSSFYVDQREVIDSNVATGFIVAYDGAVAVLNTYSAEPATNMEDGLSSAITCFAVDEAMNSSTVVDLAPWWKMVDANDIK